ncbi:unnamed protein product [Hermetia illucens]|uniref:Uncharacterized protein n=2 Tax=Hermetia illucens TaxID=343691 RepID=A0A7R8UCF2_HERIL|nr:unnamed protein product [Hermetia illucens]
MHQKTKRINSRILDLLPYCIYSGQAYFAFKDTKMSPLSIILGLIVAMLALIGGAHGNKHHYNHHDRNHDVHHNHGHYNHHQHQDYQHQHYHGHHGHKHGSH